jgi:RNA polymerase sigma-70 factor (ECF subfamily)
MDRSYRSIWVTGGGAVYFSWLKKQNERELVRKLREGARATWHTFVEHCFPDVLGIAWKYLRNKEDAEDAAQTAMVKFYGSLETFDFRCSLRTWLHRITTNACSDEYSKRKAREEIHSGTSDVATDSGGVTPPHDDSILARLSFQQRAKDLPPDTKAMIEKKSTGMDYDEIAMAHNLKKETVKKRINRALAKLRRGR